MAPDDPAMWIDAFMRRYIATVAPFGPMDDDEWFDFVAAWVTAFRRHGITQGEANAAAAMLAECPPQYRNRHLPAVLELVKSGRPAVDATARTTADRIRRHHEDAVQRAKGARLQAVWEGLDDTTRAEITERVRAENPGLARFPAFLHKLCLAELQGVRV